MGLGGAAGDKIGSPPRRQVHPAKSRSKRRGGRRRPPQSKHLSGISSSSSMGGT